jgi:hypothetical protein
MWLHRAVAHSIRPACQSSGGTGIGSPSLRVIMSRSTRSWKRFLQILTEPMAALPELADNESNHPVPGQAFPDYRVAANRVG